MSHAPAWDHRLGRLVAGPLARAGIHPNAVTTAGLVLGLAAGALFALGGRSEAEWAALLFVLAAFLDHVDGEVARMSGKCSRFGHYYDHVAAVISYAAMFVGIGVGHHAGPYGEWAVVAGVLSGVAVAVIMSFRLKMSVDLGSEAIRQPNFLGFEPEDALYVVAPLAWLDRYTVIDEMFSFIVAAAVGAPAFLIWVLSQRQRGASGIPETKSGS